MVDFSPLSSEEALRFLAEPPEAFGRDLSGEGITERAAEEEDSRQLSEILPGGLDTPGHRFHWIISGQRKVGRIWFGPYPGSATDYYLYRLLIDPTDRDQGIGRDALAAMGDEIRAEGGVRVGLNVFASMPAAIHLYESAGFVTHRAGPTNREMWLVLRPTAMNNLP